MKSKLSPTVRTRPELPKQALAKPRREFYVQEHRKEIDDYMLGQIKKNKKSIKHIKNQVQHLRHQMALLQQQNKKQRSEYDMLSLKVTQIKQDSSQRKLDATTKRESHLKREEGSLHKTRRQFVASKDSSRHSSASSRTGEGSRLNFTTCRHPLKSGSCGKEEQGSKVLLKKKIENLKEKAHMIRQNAEEIQQEISRKIERKVEHSHHKNTTSHHTESQQRYEELMELLKTNKRIEDQPQPNAEAYSEKSIPSTHREGLNHLKKSVVSYYMPEPNPNPALKPPSSQQLPSETNLLDSNKHIGRQTPRLQLSHCLEIQVQGQQGRQQGRQQGKEQFQQMLREVSGGQLSFEEGEAGERQLKELQFQFDQLVRQQLMSNDQHEKQLLGKNIRSLLTRIGQLRQQLHP